MAQQPVFSSRVLTNAARNQIPEPAYESVIQVDAQRPHLLEPQDLPEQPASTYGTRKKGKYQALSDQTDADPKESKGGSSVKSEMDEMTAKLRRHFVLVIMGWTLWVVGGCQIIIVAALGAMYLNTAQGKSPNWTNSLYFIIPTCVSVPVMFTTTVFHWKLKKLEAATKQDKALLTKWWAWYNKWEIAARILNVCVYIVTIAGVAISFSSPGSDSPLAAQFLAILDLCCQTTLYIVPLWERYAKQDIPYPMWKKIAELVRTSHFLKDLGIPLADDSDDEQIDAKKDR